MRTLCSAVFCNRVRVERKETHEIREKRESLLHLIVTIEHSKTYLANNIIDKIFLRFKIGFDRIIIISSSYIILWSFTYVLKIHNIYSYYRFLIKDNKFTISQIFLSMYR